MDLNIEKKTQHQGFIKFGFSIFRKLTFTGLGMNFHSHTSYNYKLNNIRTLLYRAYTLCDTWINMDREIKFLINYFRTNAYPDNIIYKTINNFMTSKCTNPNEPRKLSVSKLILYQKIPFINNLCTLFFKREMSKMMSNFYPHIDFRPVFFNPFTIGTTLSHKERLPECLRSGICYNFVCSACGATYVGSSLKCLRTRADQHFGRSSRTGNLLGRPFQSKVRDHVFSCDSSFLIDNFKILGSYNNDILLRIAESIEIKFRKPNINGSDSSFPLVLLT